MRRPVAERTYRYKLHLTAEQTDVARPSILINRVKLMEADSLTSPEIAELADTLREHAQLSEKDRYILAFSLMTARQLLGQATKVSPRLEVVKACLEGIDRDVMA